MNPLKILNLLFLPFISLRFSYAMEEKLPHPELPTEQKSCFQLIQKSSTHPETFEDLPPSCLLKELDDRSKYFASLLKVCVDKGEARYKLISEDLENSINRRSALKAKLFPGWKKEKLQDFLLLMSIYFAQQEAGNSDDASDLVSVHRDKGDFERLMDQENLPLVKEFLILKDKIKPLRSSQNQWGDKLALIKEGYEFYEDLPKLTRRMLWFLNYYFPFVNVREKCTLFTVEPALKLGEESGESMRYISLEDTIKKNNHLDQYRFFKDFVEDTVNPKLIRWLSIWDYPYGGYTSPGAVPLKIKRWFFPLTMSLPIKKMAPRYWRPYKYNRLMEQQELGEVYKTIFETFVREMKARGIQPLTPTILE